MELAEWFKEIYTAVSQKIATKVSTHQCNTIKKPYIFLEKENEKFAFNKISAEVKLHIFTDYLGSEEEEKILMDLRKLFSTNLSDTLVFSFKEQKSVLKISSGLRQKTITFQVLINVRE